MAARCTSRDATKSDEAGLPSKVSNVLLANSFWYLLLLDLAAFSPLTLTLILVRGGTNMDFGRPEPSAEQQVGHAIPGFLKIILT